MKEKIDVIKKWILEHDVLLIFLFSTFLSISAFLYFYNAGLIAAYGDSRGHLNIARRVFDSYSPGVAQLGGYWLPLLHVLMFPTIWIDFFWQTGISGSIPNMVSYIVSVVFIYKLVLRISGSRFASFIAFIIVAFNLNFLYMQVTPMTESLFICTLILSIYFFYRWIEDQKRIQYLTISSVFILLSSLNRYEGWLLALGAVFILSLNLLLKKFGKQAEGYLVIFSTIAITGILFWIMWGFVIFGDPLEFMHNDLSAGKQTTSAYGREKIVGQDNIKDAVLVNLYSANHTSGILLVGLFIFSLVFYLVNKNRTIFELRNMFLLLLLAPFVFDILTVFIGNVPVEVPQLSNIPPPGNYFNIRYSLYLLPAIAVFIAIISKRKILLSAILIFVIFNYLITFNFYKNFKNIVTLKDAGIIAETYPKKGLNWFKENYDHGEILASTGAFDAYMHDTGFLQKKFIVEGSYGIWDKALVNPEQYARWIIISDGNERDRLYEKLDFKLVNKNYNVAYKESGFTIYKRK